MQIVHKIFFSLVLLFLVYNNSNALVVSRENLADRAVAVRESDAGTHYEVVLDYNAGLNHYDMGYTLGQKIINKNSKIEKLLDDYVSHLGFYFGDELIKRAEHIKVNIPENYLHEIQGMAKSYAESGGKIKGEFEHDGEISETELFILNLVPDIARATQCSAVAVFGNSSKNGNTITGRVLDWMPHKSLTKLHSITTIKNRRGNSAAFIGFLGFGGVITAINEKGVFAGILDSPNGNGYQSQGRRSYTMDLRYALENFGSAKEVGEYMIASQREYTFSHLIFLTDKTVGLVVENDLSSPQNRKIRYRNSKLNFTDKTDIKEAIIAVNSFVLKGNFDNHNSSGYNKRRWLSYINNLKISNVDDEKVDFDEIKSALYTNSRTQQQIVYETTSNRLEIAFKNSGAFEPVKLDY